MMMLIYSAHTPSFAIRKISGSVRRWIYLGNRYKLHQRWQALLPEKTEIDYSKKLYEVSSNQRKAFVHWIDRISLKSDVNQEWLFSVPAVKNPYFSNLYLNVCYFLVLKEYLSTEPLDLIVVDSPALIAVLKRAFKGRVHAPAVNGLCVLGVFCYNLARNVYRFLKNTAEFIKKRLLIHRLLKDRAQMLLKEAKNPILIRSYISGNYTDSTDNISERHYFPGLNEYLRQQGFTPIYFPFTVNVTSLRQLLTQVKDSQKVIVLPEELLKMSDYIYAMLSPVRALAHRVDAVPFAGVDLKELVDEDYGTNITEYQFMYASLLSRLGRRLHDLDFRFHELINWAENQAIEKGFLYGLRRFYPDMKLIASQAFVMPPNHLSIFLSEQDRLLGLIPDQALVPGPIWKDSFTEFIEGIKPVYNPPFRYDRMAQEPAPRSPSNNLLVLMGYSFSNTLHIIRSLMQIESRLRSFDHVFIKLHPYACFQKQTILEEVGESGLPSNFTFIDGQLEDYLDKIDIGICGATGTAIELVSHSIPVIVVAEKYSLTMNYIAYREDHGIWELCFSPEDIASAVERFRQTLVQQPDQLSQKAREFRQAFFAQSSEGCWDNLLVAVDA